MHAQDASLLILSALGLFFAVVTFFIRRRQGKSRALATVFSIWIFGITLALGVLFGFVPFSKHSMGLERIVVPFMILIGTAVVSSMLGFLVHLFDHRKIESAETLPLEAQILLQDIKHRQNETPTRSFPAREAPSGMPAWRQFAFENRVNQSLSGEAKS